MPDVDVGIASFESESGRVIGTAIAGSRTVPTNGSGSVIDRMRPRVRAQNRESLRETFLQLRLQCVITRAAQVARRCDRIRVGNVNEHDFTRSWPTLIVASADVLKYQEVAAKRTNVTNFSKPAGPKLVLNGEVVLVIHLILVIRIGEKNETAVGRRSETRTWRGNGKRRRRHSVIKRIASPENCRTTCRTGDRRARITGGARARIRSQRLS